MIWRLANLAKRNFNVLLRSVLSKAEIS